MHELTTGQKAAHAAFVTLMLDPDQQVLVIEGFAGCGKTYLVNEIIRTLPKTMKMAELVTNNQAMTDMILSASTNKAAHALSEATGCNAETVHKTLGLKVKTDYRTGKSTLVESNTSLTDTILIIDEASFINSELLNIILRKTKSCKVVLIGDPAQLANPEDNTTPVFGSGFITSRMTEVVRQAEGNPIIELATAFREVVNGNPWPKITLSPEVSHLNNDDFITALSTEFKTDWTPANSKIVANTNKRVQIYNSAVREMKDGTPHMKVGDWVVCNSFVSNEGTIIGTDENVQIQGLYPKTLFGIEGHAVSLLHRNNWFMPKNQAHKKKAIAEQKKQKQWANLSQIYDTWVDLRSPYASTVYKAQGSTYKKVFIDLNDIGKTCRDPNQIARLLYVAVSRASEEVIMTGDLR